MTDIKELRRILESIRDAGERSGARAKIVDTVRELPKSPECLDLFRLAFDLLGEIENPIDRRMATVEFAKEVPSGGVFHSLFIEAVEAAVVAADALDEHHRRTTELMRLGQELPKTEEFRKHRAQAWRLALGLPDAPRYHNIPLEKIAWELPKASDIAFYTRFTLLGVARELAKSGEFKDIYREAIQTAINAAAIMEEPYFKKYALMAIAGDLPKKPEFFDLFRQIMTDACKAALDNSEPFTREHAIIEMVHDLPRTEEFYPLLQEMLEEALSFFTVKKWMGDVEVFDVVDFILSAEDTGINESKKNRYLREKYSKLLAAELEKLGPLLTDTRFIGTLSPYTHVWIQPKLLREAVKKVVDHLESLSKTFHGKEIERPVFLREVQTEGLMRYVHRKDPAANECVAIDLGATNTIIMRKKGNAQPDFVPLSPISRQYDERVCLIPTVLGSQTNTIGADVREDSPIINIKQMLLDGNPKGREYMERFFRVLYQHLKKVTTTPGWLPIMQKNTADVLYVTVPVGYADYREAMRSVIEKNVKGLKAEFLEEPLAAAIGYQVVEERDKVVMIIDFGGSTLNTMLVRLNKDEVHVVSKPERAQILGGHDIDLWLAEYLGEKAGLPKGEPPYRLITAAEEIKIGLSAHNDVQFEWDGRFVSRITRAEFEEVLDSHDFYRIVDRTISYVLKRAEKVGVKRERIEAVLLTGGSSQIPSFKAKIGDLFPKLRKQNLIYDHSPLTAVAVGASLYGTRDITDRHLGMAYALRYSAREKDVTHSYSIVLEKGEALPLEKTFTIRPAKRLGKQTELLLEVFEVPDSLITRKWVSEGGIEFIKQDLKQLDKDTALNQLKSVPLSFKDPVEETEVTFIVDDSGQLSIKYGPENAVMEPGLRLQ